MAATRSVAMLSAFGCGAVVAFAALAALQDVHAASVTTVHTCVAADGVLHVTQPNVPCQPEERRVRVRVPEPEDPECKEDNSRLEKLKRRLNALEAEARRGTFRGRKAVAPFDIVNKGGERLVRIEEQNVTFYNRDQKPVVWIVADNSGGALVTQSVDGNREAMIAAQDKLARVLIKENGHDRIDAGRRANGRYGLQVFSKDKMVAYLGQSAVGSGLALINDIAGSEKVRMYVHSTDHTGRLEVWNNGGKPVAVISGSASAGHLVLMDGSGGTIMAEAGVNDQGAGVVRTGPSMRGFGVGIVGLVPSMIVGKP